MVKNYDKAIYNSVLYTVMDLESWYRYVMLCRLYAHFSHVDPFPNALLLVMLDAFGVKLQYLIMECARLRIRN